MNWDVLWCNEGLCRKCSSSCFLQYVLDNPLPPTSPVENPDVWSSSLNKKQTLLLWLHKSTLCFLSRTASPACAGAQASAGTRADELPSRSLCPVSTTKPPSTNAPSDTAAPKLPVMRTRALSLQARTTATGESVSHLGPPGQTDLYRRNTHVYLFAVPQMLFISGYSWSISNSVNHRLNRLKVIRCVVQTHTALGPELQRLSHLKWLVKIKEPVQCHMSDANTALQTADQDIVVHDIKGWAETRVSNKQQSVYNLDQNSLSSVLTV